MANINENTPLLDVEVQNESNFCARKIPLGYLIVTVIVLGIIVLAACLGVYYGSNPKHNDFDRKISGPYYRSQPNYRLPTTLEPIEYYISLQIYLPSKARFDPQKSHFFDGSSMVTFFCKFETDKIVVHGDNLTIYDYSVYENGPEVTTNLFEGAGNFQEDIITQQLVFPLNRNCTQGKYYAFSTRYTGYLSDDLKGFYKTQYTDQGEKRWLAVTQLEPTGARRVAPIFDEPAFKSIWHLTLTYPAEMVALGNMKIRKTIHLEDGWKRSTFNPTLKMSSYILAFFVGDFVFTESNKMKTRIRVYSRHDFINQTLWAGYCAPKALDFFENYYNIKFPLNKIDLVALPQFDAGAMENWGLIPYREEEILYDRRLHPPSTKQLVATVTSHEMAHQWFGNLVTMDWWSDIWLNEGFASLMEYKGGDFVGDFKWDLSNRFIINNVQKAMHSDELPTSHPVFVQSETPSEISLFFDDISFEKGSVVLSMFNQTVGNQVMVDGLHHYLTKYAFSNANHQDLLDSFQMAADKHQVKGWDGGVFDVNKFMNRWIEQMGFPMVNVKRKGNELQLTQSRFLLEGHSDPSSSKFNYEWYTPLWYLNRTNSKREMTWLRKISLSGPAFPIGSWYLINPDVYGMYRVNYDDQNWRLLQLQLQRDHSQIEIGARSQIIDDAFTLAGVGSLDYSYALNLTCYLSNERDYVPWATVYHRLDYIGIMLAKSNRHYYLPYKRYIMSLLNKMYSTMAVFDNSVSEDDVMWYDLQESTINRACRYGHIPCIKMALDAFEQYSRTCHNSISSDPECNKIPVNIRQVVYCTAVKIKGQSAYKFLFQKQFKETQTQEIASIFRALSCAQDEELILRLLDSTINGDLVRNQVGLIYNSLPQNLAANGIVWEWMTNNWKEIIQIFGKGSFGSGELGDLMDAATRNFNTKDDYNRVKDFMESQKDLGWIKGLFEKSLSAINANIQWLRRHKDTVVTWLRSKTKCSF